MTNGATQEFSAAGTVTIEVSRSNTGEWEVIANSVSQGTVMDATHTAGSFSGVLIKYSSNGRSDDFYFDDFDGSFAPVADTSPPEISSVEATSATTVRVTFNEEVNAATAETATNYGVDNGISVTAAVQDASDARIVDLTVDALTNGQSYVLTVSNVEDANGNAISANSTSSFEYIVFAVPSARDIVINEFITDPDPATSLPQAEFVELFNPTGDFYDLNGFTIEEESFAGAIDDAGDMPTFVLRPGAYVIVCNAGDASLFGSFGDVIEITSFPDFNQTNSSVKLLNASDVVVDQITYQSSAPRDGISFEQINPTLSCTGEFNFSASVDASGGTPGQQNSVFDDTPDTEVPTFQEVEVIDPDSLHLTFSETIDPSSLGTEHFSLDGFAVTNAAQVAGQLVAISLDSDLISPASYTIDVSNLSDCSGNAISSASQTFRYDVSGPVLQEVIVASNQGIFAIFDEPLDESSAEDEEHYALDQGIGEPERAVLQDTSTTRVLLTFDQAFDLGTTYLLTFDGAEDTLGNVGSGGLSFDFQSETDTVQAITSNVLQVRFVNRASTASGSRLENYVIEDIGHPTEATVLETDSNAFRLVFAEAFDDNEDILLYMEGLVTATAGDKMITPAFSFRYDTDAPSIDQVTPTSSKTLHLAFDELLNPSAAANLSFYQLEDDSFPIEASVQDSTVILTFANDFEIEIEKTLTYTRVPDLYGNFSTSNRTERFTYDPRPPQLDTVYQLGSREVILQANEALLFSALQATHFSIGGVNPTSLKIFGPDSARLMLSFGSQIAEQVSLPFSIQNWSDLQGNSLSEEVSGDINTLLPQVVAIEPRTDTTLYLRYSQPMSASAFDVANYATGTVTFESLEAQGDTALLLHAQLRFDEGEKYSLRMSDVQDISAQSLQLDEVPFTFETYLDQVEVVDSITVILDFDTEFGAISNTSFEVGGFSPVIATLGAEDKTEVQLILRNPVLPNQAQELFWHGLTDLYDRRLPDHEERFVFDTRPPTITSVESGFDGALRVGFSETLELETLEAPTQFEIVGIGGVNAVEFQNDSVASVVFPNLVANTPYQLIVNDFQDVAGNLQEADTLTFTYLPPAIPSAGTIIITEIMADPTPVQGLPEEEFIELLNVSSTTYNLSGLSLSKSSGEVELPDVELAPGEYVAFVDPAAVGLFDRPTVAGLAGLFSFTNDGDSIVLQNRLGEVVDRVEYELSWYRDTEKDNGGFSLELINPQGDCGGAANWTASTNELGGTPGFQNSVFSTQPETDPPLVLSSQLLGGRSLRIQFNEQMDPSTLVPGNFMVPGLEIATIASEDPFDAAVITFNADVPSGQLLEMTVNSVSDCSGNVITATMIEFAIGGAPGFLDLIITEIFSDPDPMIGLPDAEYLEIQNVSNELISLDHVSVRDATGVSQPIGGILSPGETMVLAPSGELAEFTDLPAIGVGSWRSITNTGERLALVYNDDSSPEEVIFQIDFEAAWHDPDKRDGGYSLEMRDTGNPCGLEINWGSSIDPSGGTPGATNSVVASVPDNFGPQLINAFALTADSIRLDFDEHLLPAGSGIISISQGIAVNQTFLSEDQPHQLLLSVSPPLEDGVEYQLTTREIRDCLGNMRDDNEALLVLPVEALPGEVVLSEVLFDPRPDGFDFVEMYNTTDLYLTIREWSVANEVDDDLITEDELILGPEEYMVLTENKPRLLLDYPQTVEEAVFQVAGLPTLPNTEGIVKIVDNLGRIQDSLFYEDDFHNPLLADREGVSLERIDFDTPNNSDNWISASSTAGFATPGFANSQMRTEEVPRGQVVADPKVFIPGSSNNLSSFTTINYDFETAGQFANITLYDQNGRLVRRLAEGLALSSSGFVTWDGTNDSGAAVRMGYYLIVFEVFGAGGSSDVIKETVVVGRDF